MNKVLRLLIVLILGLLLATFFSGCSKDKNRKDELFPDKSLENMVRKTLNKPEGVILKSDLEKITELEDSDPYNKLNNLDGIEHLVNLEELYITLGNIEDVTPLKKLTKLRVLFIDQNEIKNIEPLADLINLEVLNISCNELQDISPVANLTKLKDLRINYNKITNIEPINNLTKLESFSVRSNKITDISPISRLYKLNYLDIEYNNITNISPIKNLKNLKILLIQGNPIKDYTPLNNFDPSVIQS